MLNKSLNLKNQEKSQSNNTVVTNAQIEDDNLSVMTGTLLTEQTSIRQNTRDLEEQSLNHDNESIMTATNLSIISSANSFSSDDTVKGFSVRLLTTVSYRVLTHYTSSKSH